MIEVNLSDPWLAFGVGVFVMAVLAVALLSRRDARPAPSTDAKLDALSVRMKVVEEAQKVSDHDLRNVRAVVQNLPTKESIAAIGNQVAESQGQITGMQSTLMTLTRGVDRIEDFLLKAAGDAIVGRRNENK